MIDFNTSGNLIGSAVDVRVPKDCAHLRRPRVAGENGRFVLYRGENCEEGAATLPHALYLTDVVTNSVYFISETTDNPYAESGEYDIYDRWIGYRSVTTEIILDRLAL
jgi:hypothetical protein